MSQFGIVTLVDVTVKMRLDSGIALFGLGDKALRSYRLYNAPLMNTYLLLQLFLSIWLA